MTPPDGSHDLGKSCIKRRSCPSEVSSKNTGPTAGRPPVRELFASYMPMNKLWLCLRPCTEQRKLFPT